ncbi:MAG: Flp pilus assembly protein CpaB [Acidobacteriota bacterium]
MTRNVRTILVLGGALVLAAGSTYLVYRTIQSRPTKEVEIARAFAVVAAHQLPLGTMLAEPDVKLVPWPAANMIPGGLTKIEEAVGRGVISPVSENEPLTGNNLASKLAGAGLPPTIPQGMRAISVRVNEVIGVAGFVLPGTRVDVMAILQDGNNGSLARVVVSNVQVLATGTKYDQDVAKEGQAIPSTVVTLLVHPDDAERVGLASNQGQIMLTLRNPLDVEVTTSSGTRTANLASGGVIAPIVAAPVPAARIATPPPAAAAPPPPKIYSVEVIRGAKRTEETIK